MSVEANWGRDKLHCIVDGKTSSDQSSWAVDVDADWLLEVLRFQEKELRCNSTCRVVIDLVKIDNVISSNDC